MTKVSRGTFARSDGRAACIYCGGPVERLRDPSGGHGGNGRYQSTCNSCHAKYQRERRKQQREERERDRALGRTVPVILTPEELEIVLLMRAQAEGAPLTSQQKELSRRLQPAGKHHARAAG